LIARSEKRRDAAPASAGIGLIDRQFFNQARRGAA
jgi:hypothetical protein